MTKKGITLGIFLILGLFLAHSTEARRGGGFGAGVGVGFLTGAALSGAYGGYPTGGYGYIPGNYYPYNMGFPAAYYDYAPAYGYWGNYPTYYWYR